jgi:hypothetical protein
VKCLFYPVHKQAGIKGLQLELPFAQFPFVSGERFENQLFQKEKVVNPTQSCQVCNA